MFLRFFTILFLLFSIPLFAETTVEDSLEESQRPIFISLSAIGSSGNSILIPIKDCGETCEDSGAWTIPIERKMLSEAKESAEKEAFENRYHKISQKGQTVSIQIGNSGFIEVVPKYYDLLDEDISLPIYQKVIGSYINKSNFLDPTKKILIDSLPYRLDRKVAITPEITERVLRKSYVSATYIDGIFGEFYIHRSSLDKGYKLQMRLDVTLKTTLYKFSTTENMFLPFGEFETNSFSSEQNISEERYFESPLDSRPSARDGEKLLKKHFKNAFKSSYSQLLKKLENLDEFKSRKTIKEILGTQISFTKNRHYRIDSPVIIETPNDEVIGWGKVRSENAINLLYLEKPISTKDFVAPAIWNGFSIDLGSSFSYSGLLYKNTEYATMFNMSSDLKLKADLGYIFDSENFSEWWIITSMKSSSDSLDFKLSDDSEFHSGKLKSSIIYSLGIEKHKYFVSPLHIFYGGGFATESAEYQLGYSNPDYQSAKGVGNLSTNSYEAYANFGIGYLFTKELGIYSDMSYSYPFVYLSDISEKDGGYSIENRFDESEFSSIGRFSFSFGLSYRW
jgi:hypothetical protein